MTDIKKIMRIALPAMGENFLQMLMGAVDTYLVARLGIFAVSGVSLATNILSVYQALLIALGAAISSFLAQGFRQEKNQQEKDIKQVLSLTFWLGLTLTVLSILGSNWLIQLIGASDEVSDLATLYLSIVGGGAMSLAYQTSFGAMLRVRGKNHLPLYVSILSNILNIILSTLAVFFWKFGIVGVALSTVFSRLFACVILYHFLSIKTSGLFPTWYIRRKLLSLAIPTALERLMMRLGDVVILMLIVHLGTAVVAGNAIGETLIQFNHIPALGIATATLILSAKSKVAPENLSLETLRKLSYVLSTSLMLLTGGILLFFGKNLNQFFTQEAEVIAVSMMVLLFSFIGTAATAGTLTYTALWQGLGNAKLPFYVTTTGMWLIRIGLGAILVYNTSLGFVSVWVTTILDNLFRFGVLHIAYLHYKK